MKILSLFITVIIIVSLQLLPFNANSLIALIYAIIF